MTQEAEGKCLEKHPCKETEWDLERNEGIGAGLS